MASSLEEKAAKALSGVTAVEPKAIPVSTPAAKIRARRQKGYIKKSIYDQMASVTFGQILNGDLDVVRPSVKVPENHYSDVKHFLAKKRQSFQEYVWALILQDLAKHERAGSFIPERSLIGNELDD